MKTTHLIVVAALAIASQAALATNCRNGGTNWPTCTPPATPSAPSTSTNTLTNSNDVRSNSEASADAEARAGATSSLSGTLSAVGGAGGSGGSSSLENFSRQNMYVLPAPVQAAALPAGLCPQGDSMSIGILWNMFSYSTSSTRSEMACLKEVLAAARAAPTVHVIQAPALPKTESVQRPTAKKAAPKRANACTVATANACEPRT